MPRPRIPAFCSFQAAEPNNVVSQVFVSSQAAVDCCKTIGVDFLSLSPRTSQGQNFNTWNGI